MNPDNAFNILILEDDPDQMDLLTNFALNEIKKFIDDDNTNDQLKPALRNIRIIRVTNYSALQKVVTEHKNVLLALLDCNIPDTKTSAPHDQLVKTGHKITGQHKSVDLVTKHLPDTPITMISSLIRFQVLVTQYYNINFNLNINFIRKADQLIIKKNIRYYIRQYLKTVI